LGVDPGRIHVTGNLKFDALPPDQEDDGTESQLRKLLVKIGVSSTSPILVAGSTHPGEEAVLMNIVADLRNEFSQLFLILAPRHIQRAPHIAALGKKNGIITTRSASAERR
jgi:3-deoxy-D-manno-octulosonic-acid transferase